MRRATPFPPVTFDSTCYRIGGKPAYLYSGEFHYFRVPMKDWRRRMRLFKEAGGNCLATYVPWLIHEPEEGRFAFGPRPGSHDLEGFLKTAAEEGLYVVARPGPYQYSELVHFGLPRWLCEGYPELRAHDREGRSFQESSVSYLHPLFLEKVKRWLAEVCPRIARWTVSRGGPVAFTQFDNELGGIHTWFGSLDYNAKTIGLGDPAGRFPRFLEAHYGDIRRLNEGYGTSFAAFADVVPIAAPPSPGIPDIRRLKDYFRFYQGMLAEYAVALCAFMREYGIDTPFVHNSAAPGMNAWFKPLVEAMREPFLLGSDHYYTLGQDWAQNNPTPQHAVHVFLSMEMLKTLGMPPTVFELPGGSLSDWPPVTPEDAGACYRMNIGFGMKGSNFYILTGGPNVPGTGVTSDIYDYGAAIGARGEIRPLYKTQKEVGLFLKRNPWLAEAVSETDVRLGLDFEMPVAESYGWRSGGGPAMTPAEAWTFTHRGIVPTAFCAGLSPACVDLAQESWIGDTATPLLVASSTVMPRIAQEHLAGFLRGGGRLLLAPVVPELDEHLQSCTILADALDGVMTVKNAAKSIRVTVAGVPNIYMNGAVFFLENLSPGAAVLGADEVSGRPLAARWKPAGGGEALLLGFRWSHAKREHEAMLTRLLKALRHRPKIACSNPNVWVTMRTAGKRSALFLMNLLSAPMDACVKCRPAWSGKMIDTKSHRLMPVSVKVILLKAETE